MKRWYFPHWQYMVIIGHELRSNWVHSALRCQTAIGPDSWWRHQMETFSALLAICVGNSPVPGEFPSQRPVTMSFDVFFDLPLGLNDWVNNPEVGDLRHYRAHYVVIVMSSRFSCSVIGMSNGGSVPNMPVLSNNTNIQFGHLWWIIIISYSV